MEKRFGVKDFILFVLVAALLFSVWLAMKQYDRQWEVIGSINRKIDSQTRDLRDIQDSLRSGIVMHAGGPATTQSALADPNDPFAAVRASQMMPDYARGDWLVDLFPGQVAKITPLLSGDAYAAEIQDRILETLAGRDPDTLEFKPLLAANWQIIDNSKEYAEWEAKQKAAGKTPEQISKDASGPNALKIRFKMRDGSRFSDGEPLTADDVVFTYNLIMNPDIAAPRDRSYYERIKAVNKIGPLEVEFVFSEPYFQAFELAGGLNILPRHFYEQYKPEAFNQSVGLLMGSGPYRMEDPKTWKPGTPIILVRNERYWGVAPAFERLIYKELSSDKGRLAAFRNGDADLFAATPEQYREMIADKSLMARVQGFVYQNPVGGYRYIAWNEVKDGKPTQFADRRVRQALTMLTDRQRMIDEIMLGYAVVATGPFNPLSKQYNPNVQAWPYDVERAKKLLAEAGFKSTNSEGVLVGPDGKPFEFRLTYPAGSGNYDKMVLFLKDAYAKAGIVLKPDALEWAVFTERLEQKNFEAISLGWTAGVESDIFQMFHSSQMVAGGDDFMSYKNPEFDGIIDQARRTVDEQARMPLWQRAHEILHEDQPYTFLWYGKSLVFVDSRIHNVKRVKLGLNRVQEWFVPRGLQKYTQQ